MCLVTIETSSPSLAKAHSLRDVPRFECSALTAAVCCDAELILRGVSVGGERKKTLPQAGVWRVLFDAHVVEKAES